ncbi:DNAj domain-containing protein [Cryptosporidium canis]|uniref:DNAj domain-containing protein n=1 Tax=Cryptosporidium canis TaxID=195482 RepID=A0A9D5HX64_9CRYT|nr:DNAj domain-containing protein [Cryptosporidium canis]
MGKRKTNHKQELNLTLQRGISSSSTIGKSENSSNKCKSPKKIIPYFFLELKWGEVKEALLNLSLFLLILGILISTIVLRAGEEFYSINRTLNKNEGHRNYYEVLGVSKKSSNLEIRKAFRKLSLIWHPDKNPGCEPCLEKFRDISKAYEVLGDEEKRQVYDTTQGGEIDIIPSAAVTLTSDNFDDLILFQESSSWVIQVYTDHDELCHYFSSIWEESIEEMGKYYKFGRIHAKKESSLLKKLPLHVKVFPAIFIITNGYPYEMYSKIYDPSLESFIEFLSSSFPMTITILNSEKSVNNWIKKDGSYKQKVLIVSNKPSPSLLIRSFALRWSSLFEFAYFYNNREAKTLKVWGLDKDKPYLVSFTQSMGNTLLPPKFLIPLGDSSIENAVKTGHINDQVYNILRRSTSLLSKLELSLLYLQQSYLPFINGNNAKSLCESNRLNRIVCLLIIQDKLDGRIQVKDIIQTLNKSHQEYIQNKGGSEYVSTDLEDEPNEYSGELFIQPAIAVLSSRIKGVNSLSKIKGFMELFHNANLPTFLLIDVDGDRYSALESLDDIYQRIVDEEIYWNRLPKTCTSYNSNNLYKNCLSNHYEGLSFLQVMFRIIRFKNLLYIAILVASIYFVKELTFTGK